MNLSKEKFLINRHSERSHAVAKSKNLGHCVIASLVRGVAISCLLFLAACGDDPKVGGTEEDAGIVAIEDKTISGVSQKGPFVNGSSVTVYGLDGETLAQTGKIYEGKIKSDMGDFSVKVVKLASQYALLKANGFYRNEVTGEKSNSQMTLYALTDLSDRDEVNVNLLTHLAYERSLYLATDSLSVSKAKKQAEGEVFKSFEIEGDFDVAEDLNIFGENDQSAALLAISVLMQGDLKEADFSERLDNYARDIEVDGVWDDKNTATAIADWASEKSLSGGLASVRANVEKWGELFGVPPFEKYANNFWWQNYGLGTCDAKREGEVKINSNALSANNGVHFICNSGGWRVATDLEKDTYKWKAGKDADVKFGDVVKTNCYVFEDKAWRSGNDSDCSLDLRGCTSLRQDTVGLGSDKEWYTCDGKKWRNATDCEKDTYGHKCIDGKIFKGKVNSTAKYVCDEGVPREVNSLEYEADSACTSYNRGKLYILPKVNYQHIKRYDSYFSDQELEYSVDFVKNYSYYKCTEKGWRYSTEKLNQGTVTDLRDGQIYKTIGFKDKIWMAENMNYVTPGKSKFPTTFRICDNHFENCEFFKSDSLSYCYNNVAENCTKYGRIYKTPDAARGACPDGWRLPEVYEFVDLFLATGYKISFIEAYGYLEMRSETSHLENSVIPFLPHGGCIEDGYDESLGTTAYFDMNEKSSYFWYYKESALFYYTLKLDNNSFSSDVNSLGSVRCVKDEE